MAEVFQVVFGIWGNNVDEGLDWFLEFSADCCALSKRCSMTYFHGPARCGKDTLACLPLNFFGDRSFDGMAWCLPSEYFTTKHSPQPDAPSAMLNACRRMRHITNNEIPEHTFFNVGALKPLVEQGGSWMVTRGLYENPEPWRGMGGVHCSGNYELALSEKQATDTGRGSTARITARSSRTPASTTRCSSGSPGSSTAT